MRVEGFDRMAERMNHETMRRASDATAGRSGEAARQRGDADMSARSTPEPIPGERDDTTAAPPAPGIVGTTGYGTDVPPDLTGDPTLSPEARQQNRWEGGGRTAPERGQAGPAASKNP